ncbi:hypothetical protein Tco_1098719 [Tanacetum coccineum]
MLRHRLTVPPSYCQDVVVAGNVIQTVLAGLRESYECLASVPMLLPVSCWPCIVAAGYKASSHNTRQ